MKIVETAENKLKKINASYPYLFRIIPDNIYLSVPYCNSQSTWIMEEELKNYKVINEIEKLLEKDYYVKRSLSIEDIIKNEIKNLNLEKNHLKKKKRQQKNGSIQYGSYMIFWHQKFEQEKLKHGQRKYG